MRFSVTLAGKTAKGGQHVGADEQASLLDPLDHGSHLGQMAFPLSKQENSERAADGDRESRGALPGGQIVENGLATRVT